MGAAEALIAAGAGLVGVDTYNIDDTADPTRPVHTALLGAGIPIVEHLWRLGELPLVGARFSAVPAPIGGMGTFPVRAYRRHPGRLRPPRPSSAEPRMPRLSLMAPIARLRA